MLRVLLLFSSWLVLYASARTLLFVPRESITQFSARHSGSNGVNEDCLSFHGTYEGTSVFQGKETCSTEDLAAFIHDKTYGERLHELDTDRDALLHIQKAALLKDASVNGFWLDKVATHIQEVYSLAESAKSNGRQRVLAQAEHNEHASLLATNAAPKLVYSASSTSAFYALPKAIVPLADQLFPPDAVLVSVPSYSLPVPQDVETANSTVPHWLTQKLKNLDYSPLIDALSEDINTLQLQKDVRHLTNEDKRASWNTRHSFTTGALQAASWINATVEEEGGASCHFHDHDYGFSPNVICEYPGSVTPEKYVVMGAHYDSRGTWGYVRAPGGDDDGSGTSALLSLARLFKAYLVKFDSTVVLAFFSGEEQGLWGSRGYAKLLKEEGKDVKFMLQADMLGYHLAGEPMQIALPDRYDTIQARWLVGNLSLIYTPELQVGTTPACCSDHQSFDQQGFVSTWVFERNGPIADPKYHNSEDLSYREGYDFVQIATIAKVMLATVLEVAGFSL